MDQNYLDKMGCEIPPMESLITLMEIEQSMPFQDSALWELIKNYYIHFGNEIWPRNVVPCYITSNSK
ncbi:conserved Plasmodium protein, unknown function [Babesia microti strain RI]|uniref:Uncharacterized protein n=1 Tax=Babesia microti (strain RI) TaxID=1133968 RepID=A0A1N6LYB3_BABMR|nr:conserved Plasmodium protein, unknown function [Babesia microti strain RI]SIO73868.1 conserved Plasmodium protein, unknown function [Babesia microti strain RI]|eukprot:XP_021337920.1 conserved Plasmodium protein, unknown function [Babesia microti strain RI]